MYEEKKQVINFYCGCGHNGDDTVIDGPSAGGFKGMQLLFDGEADTEGNTYDLTESINNYQVIAVETGVNERSVNSLDHCARDFVWIVNPKPSERVGEHCMLRLVNLEINEIQRITWHFPTDKTIMVDNIYVPPSKKLRIVKVYGMK